MIHELPQLQLFKGQYSKRLFFALANDSDTAWHILDFAARQQHKGEVYTLALHGTWIVPARSADTLEELAQKARPVDSICSGCLAEFETAKEIIFNRRMMKFDEHRIVLKPGE